MTPSKFHLPSWLQSALLIGMLLFLFGSALTLMGCNRARGTETDTETPPPMTIAEPHVQAASLVDAGRYIVRIGGCNDCHTVGYDAALGDIPESEWLTGMPIGFRGPWGTTYPPNLRLFVQETPEDVFIGLARDRHERPPMPWPSLNHMHEQDVRAVYAFIKHLGPKGTTMPEALNPGVEPTTPYIVFDPVHMERLQTVSQATGEQPQTPTPSGAE